MDSEKPQNETSLVLGVLRDEAATRALGVRLAALVQPGDAIFFEGGLGAGKTALARALVQAFKPEEEVPSPTFTLVQTYEGPGFEIAHLDLYRVESPDELWELGWADLGQGLLLVEWPGRLGDLPRPADRLEILLEPGPVPESRRVRIEGFGRWRERVAGIVEEKA